MYDLPDLQIRLPIVIGEPECCLMAHKLTAKHTSWPPSLLNLDQTCYILVCIPFREMCLGLG